MLKSSHFQVKIEFTPREEILPLTPRNQFTAPPRKIQGGKNQSGWGFLPTLERKETVQKCTWAMASPRGFLHHTAFYAVSQNSTLLISKFFILSSRNSHAAQFSLFWCGSVTCNPPPLNSPSKENDKMKRPKVNNVSTLVAGVLLAKSLAQ